MNCSCPIDDNICLQKEYLPIKHGEFLSPNEMFQYMIAIKLYIATVNY